jgi:hypothetical protein
VSQGLGRSPTFGNPATDEVTERDGLNTGRKESSLPLEPSFPHQRLDSVRPDHIPAIVTEVTAGSIRFQSSDVLLRRSERSDFRTFDRPACHNTWPTGSVCSEALICNAMNRCNLSPTTRLRRMFLSIRPLENSTQSEPSGFRDRLAIVEKPRSRDGPDPTVQDTSAPESLRPTESFTDAGQHVLRRFAPFAAFRIFE